MEYESYRELYEAVYFCSRISRELGTAMPRRLEKAQLSKLGVTQGVYTAAIRIMVANELMEYGGNCFGIINKGRYENILGNILSGNPSRHYPDMYDKAREANRFFFNCLSDEEYEIYSRYNFAPTRRKGEEIVKHINFTGEKVLELGGNSGGLATAVVAASRNCRYTVVDTGIPCAIGEEFKQASRLDIDFTVGNIFSLVLHNEYYSTIILMNLLHDFDDAQCVKILQNCMPYCGANTRFLIIEDLLTREFEPKQAVMHGLRLAVECRGGKQRTIDEMLHLCSQVMDCRLERAVQLDAVHTLLELHI